MRLPMSALAFFLLTRGVGIVAPLGARAQTPNDRAPDAREVLLRLESSLTPLERDGYARDERRAADEYLDELTVAAQAFRRAEAGSSPERAALLERFAADADAAARAEKEFWKGPDAAAPTFPASSARDLLRAARDLARDLAALYPDDPRASAWAAGARPPAQAPASASAAAARVAAARDAAAQSPGVAFDGGERSGALPQPRAAVTRAGGAPQPTAEPRPTAAPIHPKTDLHDPAPPAPTGNPADNCRQALQDSPHFWGYGFDTVCGAPGGTIAGPILAGVYDALAAAGKAVADNCWKILGFLLLNLLPKILAAVGSFVLAATGVGAVLAAARMAAMIVQVINGILVAVGVVIAAGQLKQMTDAFRDLLASKGDSVDRYASIRRLTKTALTFAASAILAYVGVRGFVAAEHGANGIRGSLAALAKGNPIARGEMMVDANVGIAETNQAKGLADPDEMKLLTFFKQLNAKPRMSALCLNQVRVKTPGFSVDTIGLEVDRASAEYQAVLKELSQPGKIVGGKTGAADREIVADAFFAKAEPGVTREFLTADKNVYNNLARIAGIEPAQKPLGIFYAQGFPVTINGRTLLVIPYIRKP